MVDSTHMLNSIYLKSKYKQCYDAIPNAMTDTGHCPGRTVSLLQMNQLDLRNNWLKFET